jgi:hypothetical protein
MKWCAQLSPAGEVLIVQGDPGGEALIIARLEPGEAMALASALVQCAAIAQRNATRKASP